MNVKISRLARYDNIRFEVSDDIIILIWAGRLKHKSIKNFHLPDLS